MPEPVPETPQILRFFSNQPDYSAILGDMMEEFHRRAQLDPSGARRWFATEAWRNVWALALRELARTPGRTLLAAFTAYLAVNLATGAFILAAHPTFPPTADQAIIALLIQLIVPLFAGRLAARILPGRELSLALVYTSILAAQYSAFLIWAITHQIDLHFIAICRFLFLTLNGTRLISLWLGALRPRSL